MKKTLYCLVISLLLLSCNASEDKQTGNQLPELNDIVVMPSDLIHANFDEFKQWADEAYRQNQGVMVGWDENRYGKLADIHRNHRTLRFGDFGFFPDEDILLFKRYSDKETFYIAVNTRDTVQSMILPAEIANRLFVNLYTGRHLSLGNTLTLQPDEYLILSSFRTQ